MRPFVARSVRVYSQGFYAARAAVPSSVTCQPRRGVSAFTGIIGKSLARRVGLPKTISPLRRTSATVPLTSAATESKPIDGIPVSKLTVGVPKETFSGERRVAITPDATAHLLKSGIASVLVQSGAGDGASFRDQDYIRAGATVVEMPAAALSADVVLKVS